MSQSFGFYEWRPLAWSRLHRLPPEPINASLSKCRWVYPSLLLLQQYFYPWFLVSRGFQTLLQRSQVFWHITFFMYETLKSVVRLQFTVSVGLVWNGELTCGVFLNYPNILFAFDLPFSDASWISSAECSH